LTLLTRMIPKGRTWRSASLLVERDQEGEREVRAREKEGKKGEPGVNADGREGLRDEFLVVVQLVSYRARGRIHQLVVHAR
jgi:hypothetical protein